MKLDKHVIDMFTELTKPADDVKMEKTCYGTISVVDGTRYVKLDGSDLLVPAASTVKTSHGDRVTVLMKNHSLTVTGNLTAPATDGEGGSSGEAGTAATIEVGTVTTGEAGSSATVTNRGTTSAAVFDFVIPRGDKGEKGDTGPQGPRGEKGDTGTWDGTIPDHEHIVSDITDFPTSLPANGGNADTVDGRHANEIASNPNLLINPDFRINQRGQSEYADARIYCVDRWYKAANSNMTVAKLSSGISFSSDNVSDRNWIAQKFEETTFAEDTAVTLSVCAKGNFGITYYGDGMHNFAADDYTIKSLTYIIPAGKRFGTDISYCPLIGLSATGEYAEFLWTKLEIGSIATPFCPPDPATELAKCQRYYYNSKGQIVFCARDKMVPYQNYYSLPVTMRTNPTITIYDAEGTEGYASLRNDNSTKVAMSTFCANGRDFNIWATNNDMTTNSEYRISYTASAEL